MEVSMATYTHPNGGKITTNGSTYTLATTPYGYEHTPRKVDVFKWTDNAEQWIDNNIASGYYEGFTKE
jgi:hypothetical protein